MKECHWLRPVLVGQFEFLEWTVDGHLRHSRFLRLRDDQVRREALGSFAQKLFFLFNKLVRGRIRRPELYSFASLDAVEGVEKGLVTIDIHDVARLIKFVADHARGFNRDQAGIQLFVEVPSCKGPSV